MSETPSDWDSSKAVAKSLLRNRTTRRKMLGAWLFLGLAWIAVGQWIVNDWLADSPTRFLLWWSATAIHAIILIIFAMYDALSVVREERSKD